MIVILTIATFLLRFICGLFAASVFFTLIYATFKAFQK